MMRSIPSPSSDHQADLLGLDNVPLDLPLAGVPSRVLAAFVDHLFLLMIQVAAVLGGAALFALLEIDGAWAFGLVILIFFLLQWGYFACFEIALAGRTPGKMLVGLRTVSALGGRPSAAAFLIRNFLRSLDWIVGVPLMVVDRRARRLGDLVAGTLVVHHRREAAEEEDSVRFRHPDDWSAREVAVVEMFLRRAERLEADRARELAQRLLGWVARRSPGLWLEAGGGSMDPQPASDVPASDVPASDVPASDVPASDAPEAVVRLRRLFEAEA